MYLQVVLLTGFLGAVLLFVGDMILYYDKQDFISDGTFNSHINIMKQSSKIRLYVGGLIGPVAAFLYCIGFYHLVIIGRQTYSLFGWACFLINCLAIVLGGTYHNYFANLGLIGRHNHRATLDEVLAFLAIQKHIAFGLQAIGFLMMSAMIALGWTTLPRWLVIMTPLALLLLTPLVNRLPKGLHMVICGGWTNLISFIYYIALLVVLKLLLNYG